MNGRGANKTRSALADQADNCASFNVEQLKQAARGVIQGVLIGEYTADEAERRAKMLITEAERRATDA